MKTVFLACLAAIIGSAALAAPPAVLTAAVEYTGASAAEVDAQVAAPLAAALTAVAGTKSLVTESVAGRCSAVIRFEANVEPAAALDAVRDCLKGIMPKLPADCSPPVLRRGDAEDLPRLWVSVTSDRQGVFELSEIARLVSDELARMPGVADVRVFGAAERTPTLWLDVARLTACGLTAGEVERAIAEQPPARAEELKDVVVAVRNATVVRVSDVGRVEESVRGDAFAMVDQRPAVLVGISVASGEVTAAAVEKQLDRLRKTLPQGVPVELAADLIRKHYLLAEIRAEPGSSAEQARRLAGQIVDAMRAARNGTCIGFSGGGGEPFRAFIPAGDWPDGDADLRKRLAEVAHVKVRVCEVGERPPFPVRVTLSGPDRSELRRWAEAVAARVAAEQTVLDPDVTPSADQPRVKFDIDADAAKRLGLDSREIMKALRLASGSAAALRFAGGQRMNVRLGAPRGPAELLPGLHVRNANGELVPLGAVAIAKAAYEPVILLRFGTSPAVRVTGAPPSGATAAAASATLLGVATAERERLKLAADYQAAAAN